MRHAWTVLVIACAACAGKGGVTLAPADAGADLPAVHRDVDALPDGRLTPETAPPVDRAIEARANDADGPVDAPAHDAAGEAPVGADGPALPKRVLLYHFSTLVIDTVPAQLAFFKDLLSGWGYATDDSVDPGAFTDEGLAAYGAVAMINTCFSPFGDGKDGAKESAALQRFVARGGGLFGTHCAAVTFQSVSPPPLYNQLFGGQEGNGFFDGASACRKVGSHPTIDALPPTFDFTGNLDNNQFLFSTTTITVRCKWGGGEMRDVAVSWARTEGAGRVFYTNFGKVVGDLMDPVLGAKHIVPGLAWVLGR
jgi:type 1 glutamine amidotransferase